MSILVDFKNVTQRLLDFDSEILQHRYQQAPLLRGIAYTLIAYEWEGSPDILSDTYMPDSQNQTAYQQTLERLGYQCEKHEINIEQLGPYEVNLPAYIEAGELSAILLSVNGTVANIYDFNNHNTFSLDLAGKEVTLVSISEYSRLFREPAPESQDKSNWLKYTFYRYNSELKSLVFLSFMISLFGALQPFFIMSVYNFALSSSSETTLYWLTLFAVLVGIMEYLFKKMRVNILATSGKDLAVHISRNVIGKLLWLPYSMTSRAGVSSQLARLKDIDQFRKLVTAESTLSYFDMPFVIVFILAIAIMSGTAALTVLAGLVLMFIFCIYSRYIYTQATSKSTRANAMVSYQWNEILRSIHTIQGLPLLRVMQTRFSASHKQKSNDSESVSKVNSRVQALGGGLIQAIGTASIVTAVIGVMDGTSDAGAMLATVILVWKALGPIMGIYNSITKFQSLKAAGAQINNLMSLEDDRTNLEHSPPIRKFNGDLIGSGLTHRHPSATDGLTNLGFKISPGDKVSIVGPSGSGKTTLLNILAGLDERYQGAVYLDGYNIKQFNNYRYRKGINYIPFELNFYKGSLRSNFVLHNGILPERLMLKYIRFFELEEWFPDGLDTDLTTEFTQNLPNGISQRLRLALGLCGNSSNLIIIDEPLCGGAHENASYLNQLFTEEIKDATVIYTTNEPSLVVSSNLCLMLEADGSQKYFGFPDKVIASL